MRSAPAALLGRGFIFGLLLVVALSGHAATDAVCEGTDCPPCGPTFCYDPAAARPMKERKKAAALALGLPERLAKAFDEIADCPGCVSITPDWVMIVVEYDVEAMKAKYGPGEYWTSMGQPWSADAELQARNEMREGLVKSIHFILARYPCRCCPEAIAERTSFTYPDDENAWMETPGWNEDLNFHEASVVDEITSPNDLGPDPPDLTNIPESAKRPPVNLEICGGPEVPPAREVHVVCEACRPIKEEHDQLARWKHDAQIRLRALKRGQCILAQVINGARGELAATNRLASTPETEARMDALRTELEQRMEDYQSDQRKMRELEAEIADLEAKRQAALAALARCEELCRQPPPVEEVAQAPDACPGDDCPPPSNDVCTGPDCPGVCTGDDCPPPSNDVCTGPDCPPPPVCTTPACLSSPEAMLATMKNHFKTLAAVEQYYMQPGNYSQLQNPVVREALDRWREEERRANPPVAHPAPTPPVCSTPACLSSPEAMLAAMKNHFLTLQRAEQHYATSAATAELQNPVVGQALRLWKEEEKGIPTAVEQPALPPTEVFHAPGTLPGDGDGNGVVNDGDYDVWRRNFGGTDAGAATGDYNGNGVVDAADYVVWRQNFGQTAGDHAQGVADAAAPENLPAGEIPILITAVNLDGAPFTGTIFLPVGAGEDKEVPVTIYTRNMYNIPLRTGFDLDFGADAPFDAAQSAVWSPGNAPVASVSNADASRGVVTVVINALDVEGNTVTGIFDLPIDGAEPPADPVVNEIPITINVMDFEGNPITTTIHLPVDGGFGEDDGNRPVDLTQAASWTPSIPGVATVPDAGGPAGQGVGGQAAGGRATGGRVAENERPVPSDRIFINYNYFSNLQPENVRRAPLFPNMQDGGLELRATNGGSGASTNSARPAPGGGGIPGLADPVLYIEATGGSTGPVARVLVVNTGNEPLELDGYAAIEPVQISPSQRERILEQVRRAPGALQELTANFYCLELLKQAPPGAIVYRLAGAAEQARFAPAARALDAARRLYESGGLSVEGDPDTYFHSIRQWAVWTVEQSFDREAFLDAFTEHARKNFARIGQPWSDAVAAEVRRHGERRWEDVRKVLEGS